MKKQSALLLLFSFCLSIGNLFSQAQNALQIAKDYVNANIEQWQITAEDVRDLAISDNYVSDHNKVTHVYFLQRHAGIPVHNGVINVNVLPSGKVFFAGFNGIPNLSNKINATTPVLTPQNALTAVAKHLNKEAPLRWKQLEDKGEQKYIFDKGDFAYDDMQVELCYQRIGENKSARLAWQIGVHPIGGQDAWSIRVDAITGEILDKNSRTAHCSFHDHKAMRGLEFYHNCVEDASTQKVVSQQNTMVAAGKVASYNVFKLPVESPIHGARSIAYDTLYKPASPFGWHDVNGIDGAEYTITRGNNVHAYEDINSKNSSKGNEPNGGADLVFNPPYDATVEPAVNNNAAIVNLFYVNNFMHDFTYRYGFNEAAGNFQEKNYTNKGYGLDAVQAEARDDANGASLNNANFSTPSDGLKPRMQMYEWTSAGKALKINTPTSIAGDYDIGTANFGKQLNSVPITGDLAIAYDASGNPQFGCSTIKNASEVKGKIAVVDRGGCTFVQKALNAQKAGAIGVIIVNFDVGIVGMTGENASAVTIPCVSVNSITGNSIKNTLKTGTVNASLALPESSRPIRIDGDFDNGVIAHEYGHGISNRLTGGPQLSDCLNNDEQMGEGWSDFMTLITTAKAGDKGTDARGIGNFVNRAAIKDIGIRTYHYSTDISISPNTYAQSIGAETHRLGEVWTSMIWDLYWAMADAEGFDPDLIHGKGGNNKAIQLVMDGMKLQKCQPGFVNGRDAILAADEANYEGAHKCLIWDVFARRGLGTNADQGDSKDNADGIEGFKSLPECQKTLKIEKSSKDIVKVGEEITVTLAVRNDLGSEAKNTIVTDILPNGLALVSASDGGTVDANGVLSFNLGSFAKDAKKILTYKAKVTGQPSKSLYFEGFNGKKSYEDNWVSDQVISTGAFFEPTQNNAYEGTWSLSAELADAFESNVTTNLSEDKGILVTGSKPVLRFFQNYKIQKGVDGVIVDISKDEGLSWKDAGSLMFKNGYNGPIAYSTYSFPNTKGFWGDSNGWIPTFIDLKDYVGEKILFRFRFVSDKTTSNEKFEKGIFIDNIEIFDMVNYNTEACITADGGLKDCASMDFRGIKVETDRASDAKEISTDLHATLFPNPANELLNINLKSDKAGKAMLNIVDISGRVVLSQNIFIDNDAQMLTLPITQLPAGLYTVKISQDSGFLVRKFVKM